MPSQPSRQAPGDPGRQKMKWRRRHPRWLAWIVDRRFGVAQHMKGDGKSVHALFEQRLDGLRRHVAAGKSRCRRW